MSARALLNSFLISLVMSVSIVAIVTVNLLGDDSELQSPALLFAAVSVLVLAGFGTLLMVERHQNSVRRLVDNPSPADFGLSHRRTFTLDFPSERVVALCREALHLMDGAQVVAESQSENRKWTMDARVLIPGRRGWAAHHVSFVITSESADPPVTLLEITTSPRKWFIMFDQGRSLSVILRLAGFFQAVKIAARP